MSGVFSTAALMASNVATWERDPRKGLVHCDVVMAELYGLTDEEMAEGVTLERLKEAIHPDDRHLYDQTVAEVRAHGGITLLEYRVVPRPGVVRWVLVRGRYDRAEPGEMAPGRGIVIDITETRIAGGCDEIGLNLSRAIDEGSALDQAAAAALDASRAIDKLPSRDRAALRPAADNLLSQVGRALASRLLTWQ